MVGSLRTAELVCFFILCSIGMMAVPAQGARLTVNGTRLIYNGQNVFLSGTNIAWKAYGYDFGNHMYLYNAKSSFEEWVKRIALNGGNSVRIWLHVEGYNTPTFDDSGMVISPDAEGTLFDDLLEFLDAAAKENILVTFCLWNGAVQKNQKTLDLFYDDVKLQSYIDNALKPMAIALAGHPALGPWEILNEPEGLFLANTADSEPCFDTQNIGTDGWTGNRIPMKNILKFINWQMAAIKEVDSGALLTASGGAATLSDTPDTNSRNRYTDACLVAAGGKTLGTTDIYQMHTYSWEGRYGEFEPFKVRSASVYELDKPLIIGEFASSCSEGPMTIEQQYADAYDNGYQGAWVWAYYNEGEAVDCADSRETQDDGMRTLMGMDGPGGLVNFPLQL